MVTNPISLPEQETETVELDSASKDHFMAKYVVLPGGLGGLTKIIMEVKDATNTLEIIGSRDAKPDVNLPALGYLIPSSIFLGIVSSLIGIFVLSDFLDLSKSKLKLFGLSLVFGLFFPLVFEAASNTVQLEGEIEQLEEEKVRAEEIAISSSMSSVENTVSVEKAIQNIEGLALNSSNPRIQTMAIENLQEIAANSQEGLIIQEIIFSLARIAQQSQTENTVLEALQTIENIATQSDQSELREVAINRLESLRGQVPERAAIFLEEALTRLN